MTTTTDRPTITPLRQLACLLTRTTASTRDADVEEITITTSSVDLMRDTIDPILANLGPYLAGPRAVHLFHDHQRWPVARTESLTRTARGIRARFRWLDDVPDVAIARSLFRQGALAASIEFVLDEEPVRNAAGGWHFKAWTLTGWAFTANPANPECTKALDGLSRREHILILDDERHADDVELDADTVRAAMAEVAADVANQVVLRLTGRVD